MDSVVNVTLFGFRDIVTKEAIPDVYVRVIDEVNNKIYSYRSNAEGSCRLMLKSPIEKGRLVIEHPLYYDQMENLSSVRVFSLVKKPP
jgi:hypothetical protein